MALDDPGRLAALSARYGRRERPDHILWNETIATQLAHRSVRAYLATALPDNIIETLVAAGQSAPSSPSQHLWSVIAVTDAELLAILARGQRHIEDAPLVLLWVADAAKTRHIGTRNDAPTDGTHPLDSFLTAALDAALAARNAVVAAESLGLGTVYIGASGYHPKDVADLVGLPDGAAMIFGLVVGHADPDRAASVKPRPALAILVHRDRYAGAAETAAPDAHDEAGHEFQQAQDQAEAGWIAPALARMADHKALAPRDRLRDALERRGFALRWSATRNRINERRNT